MSHDAVGGLTAALRYTTAAIQTKPGHDYALVTRGNLYRKLKDFPRALKDLDVVAVRNAQLCIALKIRFLVKRDMGQVKEGREDL